jgi:CPA1 family monovalent cation:H+ antiporter
VIAVLAALKTRPGAAALSFADATAGQSDAARTIAIVLVLLIAATILAVIARRIALPYPVLLVLGGLGLGFIPSLPVVALEPDVVFLLFLPPILFGAGYFTSIRDLKANIRPIGLLAVGLVLFTMVLVAVVIQALVPSLGWGPAFALGAIVAPPDAVAATAVFQRLGVPRRLVTILEGESLLNDATALVAYRFALAAVAYGTFSLVDATSTFLLASIGGAILGLAVGHLVALLVRRIDDEVFSVVITFLAPIAAYLPAELLGLSGVLATVAAGIWVGRHAPKALSSGVRLSGAAGWQVLLFLVNGTVFILIGLSLPQALNRLAGRSAQELLGLAVAVAVTVILARIVWVFTVLYLPKRFARRGMNDPEGAARNVVIVGWAGMRGVVSLAAALALPAAFPERDLLIFLTFAVILATLVGQGLTLPILIHRLDIDDGAGLEGQEEAYARYIAADAAMVRLEDLGREWPGHLELIDTLRAQYGHRTRHAELRQDRAEEDEDAEQELLEHRHIRLEILKSERESLINLRERGAISDDVFRRVERDLDLEELRMEA